MRARGPPRVVRREDGEQGLRFSDSLRDQCRLRELTDHARHVRLRGTLGKQQLDVAFALEARCGEQLLAVVFGEHGREELHGAQVKLACCEHLHDERELPAQASRANAQVSLGFREVQRLHTVVEHGAVRVLPVQPSCVDFGEMHEQRSGQLALLPQQPLESDDQLVIAQARHRLRQSNLLLRCVHAKPPCCLLHVARRFFELAARYVRRER